MVKTTKQKIIGDVEITGQLKGRILNTFFKTLKKKNSTTVGSDILRADFQTATTEETNHNHALLAKAVQHSAENTKVLEILDSTIPMTSPAGIVVENMFIKGNGNNSILRPLNLNSGSIFQARKYVSFKDFRSNGFQVDNINNVSKSATPIRFNMGSSEAGDFDSFGSAENISGFDGHDLVAVTGDIGGSKRTRFVNINNIRAENHEHPISVTGSSYVNISNVLIKRTAVVNSGQDVLTLTGRVGDFSNYEFIESGSKVAQVLWANGNTLYIKTGAGFEATDEITGLTSGATATVNSVEEDYTRSGYVQRGITLLSNRYINISNVHILNAGMGMYIRTMESTTSTLTNEHYKINNYNYVGAGDSIQIEANTFLIGHIQISNSNLQGGRGINFRISTDDLFDNIVISNTFIDATYVGLDTNQSYQLTGIGKKKNIKIVNCIIKGGSIGAYLENWENVECINCTFVGGGGAELLNGLISYYKFDENSGTTAFDSTSSNDGTLLGGATWTTGKINSGIETDEDKGVRTEPLARTNQDFTYSTWIYPTTSGSDRTTFVHASASSSSGNNRWLLAQDDEQVRLFLNQDSNNRVNANTNNVLTLNQWNHIVLTREGATAKIYVNGIQAGDWGVSNWDIWSNNNLFIGGIDDNNINSIRDGFPGKIDEVGLWDRALTQSEVTKLYNSGNGLTYDFGGAGSGYYGAYFKDVDGLRLINCKFDRGGSTGKDLKIEDCTNVYLKDNEYLNDEVDVPFEVLEKGTAAPSTTPMYVGQMFINTNGGNIYIAKGTGSSADWVQVNN